MDPLAQSRSPLPVIFWSAALMGAIFVLYVLMSWLRRKYLKPEEEQSAGFTLSDLRRLHKEVKLSTEEFEKAKSAIVEGTKAALKRQEQERQARLKREEQS